MIDAVRTVIWKEARELLVEGRRPRVSALSGLVVSVLFGIVLPLAVVLPLDPALRGTGAPLSLNIVYTGAVAVAIVAGLPLVIDAFAGERERHTIETLLAAPLPVSAILWGKLVTLGAYAWALSLFELLVGVSTVLIAFGPRRVGVPDALFLAGLALVALGAAMFLLLVGVLVSLSVPSVKQGQQVLSVVALPLFTLLPLSVLFPQLPVLRDLLGAAEDLGPTAAVGLILAAVLVVDGALFVLVRRRFERERLLLA